LLTLPAVCCCVSCGTQLPQRLLENLVVRKVRRRQLHALEANTRFRLCLLRMINSQNRHRNTPRLVRRGAPHPCHLRPR
jgi:hypothetical protein